MTLLICTYKKAQIHSPYINLMTTPLILNKEKCYFIKDPTQYLKIVKSSNNIKFSIDFGLTKLLKSLIYKQYRVSVFDYNSVKSFIVIG